MNEDKSFRTFLLSNGNKAHFKKHPRFGTWSMNFDKGGMPAQLSGEWQFFNELYDKASVYLATREKSKTSFVEETGA